MKKKYVVILAILFLPVVLVTAAVIGLYQNQRYLTQVVIEKVNESFTGELVIEDSYVSPFANFPYISLDLYHVKFYENKERSGKPIYEVNDMYIGFDIMDLLRGNYEVKSLVLSGGHLDIVQHENGDLNILLAKGVGLDEKEEDTEDEEDFSFELKEFYLKDFVISKLNEATGQSLVLDFDETKAAFRTVPGHLYVTFDTRFLLDIWEEDSSSFFQNKHFEIHSTIDFDKKNKELIVSPSNLKLEGASFGLAGMIDLDDDMNMNLELKGEKPDFNLLAAFAPNEVAAELKKYKNQGRIYFNGKIEGKSINGYTPLVTFDFGCEQVYFLNTSVNRKVDELGFKGYFTNGEDRSIETFEVRLENFYAKPGEGIFKGNFYIRNFKDPFVAINMNADLDLEFLAQFFGIEGLERTKGQVIINMDFDELIDMEKPQESLAQLKEGIDSDISIRNLSFLVPGYPHEIREVNAHADMEKGKLKLDYLSFKIANSDFYFDGSLSDFPALFHKQSKPIRFTLNSKSKKIDFRQLLEFDSSLAASTNEVLTDFRINMAFETSVEELLNPSPLPKGEFFIKDFYGKLKHYPHTFHDFDLDLLITDDELMLVDFSGEIDETDFHFNGKLSNYKLWFQQVPKGDTSFEFDLDSRLIKVHDLLSYEGENYLPEDYRHEELNNLKLHGKIDLHYDSTFKSVDLYLDQLTAKMKIHPLKLEKFSGRIHYEDEHLQVENFKGKMGKSDFNVNMTFYTGDDQQLKKRDNSFFLKSGQLDLDELMNYEPVAGGEKVDHDDAFNIFEVPFTDMKIAADVGKIKYHRMLLENAKARLRIQADHFLFVDSLFLKTAGGRLAMNGYFNGSDPHHIYFSSILNVDHLDLDQLLFKFDNFGQDYMVNENLHGQITGTIKSTVRMHTDFTPILEETKAQMDLIITNGSIVNFAPIQAMSSFFKDRNLNIIRFDTLRNTLDLKNGVLSIPSMNINSSLGFVEISGQQSLNMDMDYYVRIPWKMVTQVGASALFGGKRKEDIDPEQEDEIIYRDENRRIRFVNVRITGNSDDFKISLGRDKRKPS